MPGSTKPPTRKLSLAEITTKGSGLPGRYVFYGPEGCGKTSLGAFMPKPIFIQTAGETGLDTLIDAGRLHDVPHFPGGFQVWGELLAAIDLLTNTEHDYKTLVIDTFNGAERLCHEFTRRQHYSDDEQKFAAFQEGASTAMGAWREFLSSIDNLRETRRMTIACMCHSKVAGFKNPEGPDFDRYTTDMHKYTWSLTQKWADAVLFINFETFTKKEKGDAKHKGAGGQRRVMYCERHAAFDAKNRFGLPQEIDLGDSPQEAWSAFSAALKEGRSQSKTPAQEA